MDCPNCHSQEPEPSAECVRCGLVFAKWKEAQSKPAPAAVPPAAPAAAAISPWLWGLATIACAAGYWGLANDKPKPAQPPPAVQAPLAPRITQPTPSAKEPSAVSADSQTPQTPEQLAEEVQRNRGAAARKGKSIPIGEDEIAKSWGMPTKNVGKFWMDDPKTYAAAHQVDQGQLSKQWAKNVTSNLADQVAGPAGGAVVEAVQESDDGDLLRKLLGFGALVCGFFLGLSFIRS